MAIEDEIKSALARGAVAIGAREVVRAVKGGTARRVIIASNAPESLSRDLQHWTKLAGMEVTTFDGTGSQLGVLLGKPFGVAALAIQSEGKS